MSAPRCDWCVGFIRRDCRIFSRCVKTRLYRPRDRDRSGNAVETTKIGSTEGESPVPEGQSPKESS